MFQAFVKCTTLVLLALWLTGCASAPDANQNSNSAADLTRWQIKGKLAIITPDERLSLTMQWQHLEQQDKIRLSDPFGRTVLLLESQPEYASVLLDGQHHTGNSANALIQRLTGWQFPLTELTSWILGQPSGEHAVQYDANGWPAFAQVEVDPLAPAWTLTYQGWQQFNGYRIPKAINLRQLDKTLKLKLYEWQPEP
ncbi:lipoprotein insertase outer membrane protein LolB [Ferrimonas aestuarii]|uniref:Outer-membrane lipoprotein LolB n=1 Tax=Ferrimonas aestuarii TaxID=2569539 RepID=A0A4U1BMN2_9GAMM|nr:lipoprotein insertase outer membrane protein LolB [Ferrimonas aestuarii]TKB54788.1 outer membrane lipoprotein LolB [Ferrimonas aestuarii]